MKRKFSKVLNVLSIIVLLLAVFILASVVLTKDGGIPEVGGYSVMRVLTGSMEPEIPTDSIILIKRIDPTDSASIAELEVGDVICFYSKEEETSGSPITHRIAEIDTSSGEPMFITKGDANALCDKYPCLSSDIIGKVVRNNHGLGVVVRLLLNPVVFFPLIIFPLLLMIILNLVDAIKRGKQLAKEEEEQAIREAVEFYKQKKAAEQKTEEPSTDEKV